MPKFTDYREILKHEYETRRNRNSSYSLRSFARDIELLPSRLSDILHGKQGLSEKKAVEVARKLSFTETEVEYFANLVSAAHSRSRFSKQLAQRKLEPESSKPDLVLTESQFREISNWFHFAILELLSLYPSRDQLPEVAAYLGLSFSLVCEAVEKLWALGLIVVNENEKFERRHFRVATTHDVPSLAIRSYHAQILQRAQEALGSVPTEHRDFSSLNIWLSLHDLVDLKKEISEWRRKVLKRYQSRRHQETLYALSLQLFPLKKGTL